MGRKSNSKKARKAKGAPSEGASRRLYWAGRHERAAEALRVKAAQEEARSLSVWHAERKALERFAPPPTFEGEFPCDSCERDLPHSNGCQVKLRQRCREIHPDEGGFAHTGRCARHDPRLCQGRNIFAPPMDEPAPRFVGRRRSLFTAALLGAIAGLGEPPPPPRKPHA